MGSVEEALELVFGLVLGQVGLVSHQLLLVTAAAADRKLRIFEACIALQRVDNVSTGWRYSCVECVVVCSPDLKLWPTSVWGKLLKFGDMY